MLGDVDFPEVTSTIVDEVVVSVYSWYLSSNISFMHY